MRYISSAIGRKQIMGITGLVWAGFVFTHMLGNLLLFVGADAFNMYAYKLAQTPLLYIAEAGLVLTLILHVYEGIALTIKNKKARPQKYAMPTNGDKAARFQSKWMIFHGSLLLVFIILHIATFKYGPSESAGYITNVDGVQMRDLHRLVHESFQQPLYIAWYTFAMVFVGLHLSHGLYSSFASVGLYHPKFSPLLSKFGYVYAAVIFLGFISPPIAIFFFGL